MESNFIIRSFREKDIKSIVSLFNTCFLPNGALVRDEEIFRWRYIMCPDFENGDIKVVEYNGEIISSAVITFKTIFIDDKKVYAGFIDDVMTHPRFRRKGLAKQILMELEKIAIENNADMLVLYTGKDGIAHRLYQKLGFEDITTFSNYIRILNPKKLLTVKMTLARTYGIYLLIKKTVERFGVFSKQRKKKNISIKDLGLSIKEQELKEAVDLINRFNERTFKGFCKYDLRRIKWTLYNTNKTKNYLWECMKNDKMEGLLILSTQEGYFFEKTFKVGIIKLFYSNDYCGKELLTSVNNSIYSDNLDILLSIIPVNHRELRDIFNKSGYTDFSRLTNNYAVMMVKSLKEEHKSLLEKKNDRVWYPLLEHIIGRP